MLLQFLGLVFTAISQPANYRTSKITAFACSCHRLLVRHPLRKKINRSSSLHITTYQEEEEEEGKIKERVSSGAGTSRGGRTTTDVVSAAGGGKRKKTHLNVFIYIYCSFYAHCSYLVCLYRYISVHELTCVNTYFFFFFFTLRFFFLAILSFFSIFIDP